MKDLLKDNQDQIANTRTLIKQAKSREEVEAYIQHLEELLNQASLMNKLTFQKPYLSNNQGKK